MKVILERIKIKLTNTEEWIKSQEDKLVEINQSSKKKKKLKKIV